MVTAPHWNAFPPPGQWNSLRGAINWHLWALLWSQDVVHLPGYWSVGRAFVSGGRDPSVACVSGCGYCNLLAGHPPSTAFVQGHGSLAIWHCVWRWFCQQAPGRYPGSTGVPNEDTGARLRDRFSSLQSAYGWSPFGGLPMGCKHRHTQCIEFLSCKILVY